MQLKDGRQQISEKAGNVKYHRRQSLKRTLVAAIAISSMSASTTFANEAETLHTIYHVYLNDKYLGTVADKQKVEHFVNKKIKETKECYKGHTFKFKRNELSFIPDETLKSLPVNEQNVFNQLQSNYEIMVKAVALKIDGKTITYLDNKEKANEVIEKIKQTYLPIKQIERVERKEHLLQLKEGESRVTNVSLSYKVSIEPEEVFPNEVRTVDEAFQLLQKGTMVEKTYTVQDGDVLGTIAESHGLSLKQLLQLNPELKEDSLIQIGDQLNVMVYEPYVKVNITQEHLSMLKIPYGVKVIHDETMYKGDTKVVQEGLDGEKMVHFISTIQNGEKISEQIVSEKITKEPISKIIYKGTKEIPSRGTGKFTWPTNGGYISSQVGYRWGKQHKGIDIARPNDRTIKAANHGTVISAGWDGGYGNKIVIDHHNGIQTVYAHLSSIYVSVGQTVEKGKQIGIMGSTGDSTGVHLHFELYKDGVLQNPIDYLH